MRIARYWDAAANGAKYGVVEGDTVRELAGHPYREIVKTNNVRPLAATQLLAPCEPTKIIAGGANYHGHLKEVNLPVPTIPVFFLKPPTALIGPDQPVIYPPQTQKLEYEGELAVVVKSPMRNTPPGEVLKNLLGYTCVNDVTARDIQVIGGNLLHLCHSKSFETFCPTGPWVETELDAHSLDIELRINGEVRQPKTNTSDMIFPVEEMVSYFSKVMTLLPGDLILTGAPPGIGGMKVGDTVEVDDPGYRHAASHGGRRPEVVNVLAQFAVNGVVAGSVYALIALGFALIFTASRVFHFAHGGVYTLSAFAGYTVLVTLKLGLVAGFIAAIVVAAVVGVLINVLLYEPMKAGGVSPFVAMISSFGVLIIITHTTAMIWGSNPVVLSRGGQTTVYRFGPIYTTDAQLLIVGCAAALGGRALDLLSPYAPRHRDPCHG